MRRYLISCCLCLFLTVPSLLFAQVVARTKSFRSVLPRSTVANLPASPATGKVRIVTDGATDSDCEVGGGVNDVLCFYDSVEDNWFALGDGGGGGSLDAAFDVGKEIDGATSKANAYRVGSVTEAWCFYYNGSDLVFESCNAADTVTGITTNQNYIIYDQEAAADIWTIDPDAASTNAMYTIAAAYRPLKSVYWGAGAMTADGTNCTDPAEVTLDSGPETWTISCADNNGSIFYGNVVMPDSWDAGTVTFELVLFHATTETITYGGDFSAKCTGDGEDFSGVSWGTAIAADVSIVTANLIEKQTTNAVTATGTCAGGDLLYWRYVIAAGRFSTNAANADVVGVKMEYSVDSFSD